MKYIGYGLAGLLLTALTGCAQSDSQYVPIDESRFGTYWYQGEAEVTTYSLQQARYGEMRNGKAALIFVTEDFSKTDHVKLDEPSEHPGDAVKVLKLNALRQFNTGIYQYNLMRSVFTPVAIAAYPFTLKITMSAQDWCGTSWLQFNHAGNRYRGTQMSYFGSQGDRTLQVRDAFLEDEIWTRIRLAPGQLPLGKIEVIPGSFFIRLHHIEIRPYQAETTLAEHEDGLEYTIQYTNLDRSLRIVFADTFPYEISGWTETAFSGFGEEAILMETRAVQDRRMTIDYWNHNSLDDGYLRTELGL